MSKVELAGRPEPGYESMEQFSVNVEHVAEMLRTIDFQPGEGAEGGTVWTRPKGMKWTLQPEEQGLHITWPAFHLGAAGDEEDDEVALEGDESNAGLEEERLDGPEGERWTRVLGEE